MFTSAGADVLPLLHMLYQAQQAGMTACLTSGALIMTSCRENMLKGDACVEPKIFNFEWEPFSTEVAGVEVEANLFNVAPCAVLVNARGVKVCTRAISCKGVHYTCLMVTRENPALSAANCAVPVHGAAVRSQPVMHMV